MATVGAMFNGGELSDFMAESGTRWTGSPAAVHATVATINRTPVEAAAAAFALLMPPGSKRAFLYQYRGMLIARCPWASDRARLDRFMASVQTSLTTDSITWNHVGELAQEAFRGVATGRYSLKALRGLPW